MQTVPASATAFLFIPILTIMVLQPLFGERGLPEASLRFSGAGQIAALAGISMRLRRSRERDVGVEAIQEDLVEELRVQMRKNFFGR